MLKYFLLSCKLSQCSSFTFTQIDNFAKPLYLYQLFFFYLYVAEKAILKMNSAKIICFLRFTIANI